MKIILTAASVLLAISSWSDHAQAHCQVPCGIYDDAARVSQMREHLTTIEKAVKSIVELSAKRDAQSKNQLVRWVVTKERHAEKIIRTISDYFLTQKIKPRSGKSYKRYVEQLAHHHQVMVAAMKCKQHAGLEPVRSLKKTLDRVAGYWK